MKKYLFLFLFGLISFYGCSNSSKALTKTTVNKSIFKSISIEEASKLINANLNNTNFVILDVRTENEINNGHIKNAIFIDFKKDDFCSEVAKLDHNKTYLVYCKGGYRSKKSVAIMKGIGFKKLYNMLGGFDAWKNKY